MAGAGNKKDFYDVLGVPRDAADADIKKAYRRLVRKYHPDANPGNKDAEKKFKEAAEAYEVLSDSDKRAQYDQFGYVGDTPPGGGFGGGGFGGGADAFGDVFGDLFDSMFGGTGGGRRGGGPNAPRRGDDLEMGIQVTLEEAFHGVSRKVEIPRWESCTHCGGSGAEPGSSPKPCPTCGGRGQVERRQRTPFGEFATVGPCPQCQGRGKIIEKLCTRCGGGGRQRTRKNVEVKIPQGVDTGTRLRISGEGEAGFNGGPPGDLYLAINVKADSRFIRKGDDLHFRTKIAFPQAALGCEVEVPSVEGNHRLDIPAGTQSGATFRVKGKGMPRLSSGGRMGDLHVHVNVEVPRELNEKQRTLLEALAQEMNVSVVESTGFLDRMKKMFGA